MSACFQAGNRDTRSAAWSVIGDTVQLPTSDKLDYEVATGLAMVHYKSQCGRTAPRRESGK